MIPPYVQDDPTLARVYDERGVRRADTTALGRTVADLLPERQDRDELPVVDPDATILEVAAVMARMHSPLVAVVDGATGCSARSPSAGCSTSVPHRTRPR